MEKQEHNAVRFGIWKPGRWDDAGEWQPAALMKICETEAEANEQLVYFPPEYFVEPF